MDLATPRLLGRTPLRARAECVLAARHAAVSLVGFLVDYAVLHGMMRWGLEPAWARVVSLACAIHATFLLNGIYVFRCLRADRSLVRRWAAYLASNAFGNLCNYWIFVTLVSLHHAVLSRPGVALALASMSAWGINYGAARLLVFGDALRRRATHRSPRADGPGLRPGRGCP